MDSSVRSRARSSAVLEASALREEVSFGDGATTAPSAKGWPHEQTSRRSDLRDRRRFASPRDQRTSSRCLRLPRHWTMGLPESRAYVAKLNNRGGLPRAEIREEGGTKWPDLRREEQRERAHSRPHHRSVARWPSSSCGTPYIETAPRSPRLASRVRAQSPSALVATRRTAVSTMTRPFPMARPA